jgi:hypothetical protein
MPPQHGQCRSCRGRICTCVADFGTANAAANTAADPERNRRADNAVTDAPPDSLAGASLGYHANVDRHFDANANAEFEPEAHSQAETEGEACCSFDDFTEADDSRCST